jgi:hypothetical protein
MVASSSSSSRNGLGGHLRSVGCTRGANHVALLVGLVVWTTGFLVVGHRGLQSPMDYYVTAADVVYDSSPTKKQTTDPHQSHISILPLLPWEEETITNQNIQESSAPQNIPKYCALGSISYLGKLTRIKNCGGGKSTYDRVQQRVREWLPEDGVCDTCRILDIMAEKNLTLSFWGDSVQVRTCLYSVNSSTLARICL